MDYKVIIPTYKRYDKVAPIEGLGLPLDRYALCVNDEEEAERYDEFYPDITKIITGQKGCTASRNWLLENFPKGYRMVQVDDDVEGLYELRGKGRTGLVKMTGEEVDTYESFIGGNDYK